MSHIDRCIWNEKLNGFAQYISKRYRNGWLKKWQFCLLTIMLFQTCMTDFLLWNTNVMCVISLMLKLSLIVSLRWDCMFFFSVSGRPGELIENINYLSFLLVTLMVWKLDIFKLLRTENLDFCCSSQMSYVLWHIQTCHVIIDVKSGATHLDLPCLNIH